MGTPETSREPCPDRILDDLGGAFAMGAVGGSVFHYIKGAINSPKGERMIGGINNTRMFAPRTGGGFAVWGGLFSTFDCTMVYLRQKEDPWNSIIAGAATGGFLQMRQGLRASGRSALFGGCILALIEGAGIMLNRVMSPPAQIVYEDPGMGMGQMGGGGGGGGGQVGGYGFGFPGQVRAPTANAESGGVEEVKQGGGGVGGFLGGWFGGGDEKKEKSGSSSGGGSEPKVLESFDTPTPMPSFDYK